MSEHRMAWLVTTDDAVAVGDPWRDHVLLMSAPTSRTSKPGLWAFLRAAAAEATGWGSTLSSVEVAARIVHADGTDALLLLDGHTGSGYLAEDQEEARAMLRRVLEDPGTIPQIRNLIAHPDA
jgi:hypothetical protein